MERDASLDEGYSEVLVSRFADLGYDMSFIVYNRFDVPNIIQNEVLENPILPRAYKYFRSTIITNSVKTEIPSIANLPPIAKENRKFVN